MAETIGFIGLGVMGAPMARNLLRRRAPAGRPRRSPEPVDELAAAGAEPPRAPREVAERADVVITMLPDSPPSRRRAGRATACWPAHPAGDLLIDMSTIHPTVSVAVARGGARARRPRARRAGQRRRRRCAQRATLSIMVGGDADALRARPPAVRGARQDDRARRRRTARGRSSRPATRSSSRSRSPRSARRSCSARRPASTPEQILDVLAGGLAANRIMEMRRQQLPRARLHARASASTCTTRTSTSRSSPATPRRPAAGHRAGPAELPRAARARATAATTTPACSARRGARRSPHRHAPGRHA